MCTWYRHFSLTMAPSLGIRVCCTKRTTRYPSTAAIYRTAVQTVCGATSCSVPQEMTTDTGQRASFLSFVCIARLNRFCVSIGNGWAAAGMLRVLGTIKNSNFASSMTSEQQDLINWVTEIHQGMYGNLVSTELLAHSQYMNVEPPRMQIGYSRTTLIKHSLLLIFMTQLLRRSWPALYTAFPLSQMSRRIYPSRRSRARPCHKLRASPLPLRLVRVKTCFGSHPLLLHLLVKVRVFIPSLFLRFPIPLHQAPSPFPSPRHHGPL